MKKFIIKTAVKTFLICLLVLVVGFVGFNFLCPQHMATYCERLGNYRMAVNYAALRYTYTDDTYDLARCFEDSILTGDDELIVRYGDEFIGKDDWVLVTFDMTVSSGVDYYTLFGGQLVKSRYDTGNFASALELAVYLNIPEGSFAMSCPLMSLSASVIGRQDRENAPALLEVLQSLSPDPEDTDEVEALEDFIKRVKNLTV